MRELGSNISFLSRRSLKEILFVTILCCNLHMYLPYEYGWINASNVPHAKHNTKELESGRRQRLRHLAGQLLRPQQREIVATHGRQRHCGSRWEKLNVVNLNWDEPNNQPKGGQFYYYPLCNFMEMKLLPLLPSCYETYVLSNQ